MRKRTARLTEKSGFISVRASLLALIAQADHRINRFVNGPGDLANGLDRTSNKEIDSVPWSDAAPSHHAEIGAEANDPLVAARICGTELREDSNLNGGAVVYLRSVEPGEHRTRGSHTLKVRGIDALRVEPLLFNELLMRDEDLKVERTKARRNLRKEAALAFIKEGSGEVDLHETSFAEWRSSCMDCSAIHATLSLGLGAAWRHGGTPMSEQVKITVRDNGSLKIAGDFTIVDVEGNEIPHEGDSTGLCRCGHSANKPFCDGSHKEKFESVVRAPEKA